MKTFKSLLTEAGSGREGIVVVGYFSHGLTKKGQRDKFKQLLKSNGLNVMVDSNSVIEGELLNKSREELSDLVSQISKDAKKISDHGYIDYVLRGKSESVMDW